MTLYSVPGLFGLIVISLAEVVLRTPPPTDERKERRKEVTKGGIGTMLLTKVIRWVGGGVGIEGAYRMRDIIFREHNENGCANVPGVNEPVCLVQ